MMDAGVMPVDVYIDECHKQGMEFIAGFRMNDRHGHNADWFEQLTKEKPDWILKGYKPSSKRTTDPRSYELGCALDYSVEGVRDWIFSIMEDAANRFDIDGMELNYTRLPACFPLGEAEAHHATMTDFVRRVCAMLEGVGEKKGRKLLLGVRVLQHLEGCLNMGFDIPTWMKDRLIDYIAPGDIGFTDVNAQFEAFVKLARASDCYVYPQIQAMLGYYHRDRVQSPDHCRAAVQNFFGAGADGFSTQNVFEVEAYRTLKELRDPDRVAVGNRHYVFYPLWGPNGSGQVGYHRDFPYHTEEIVLDREKCGVRKAFRFRLCEHLPVTSSVNGKEVISGALMTCRPGIVPGDEIAIDINGETIPAKDIWFEWAEGGGQPPLCSFALASPPAVFGDNHLGMTLKKGSPDKKENIVLHDVEVFVKAVV